MSEYIKLLAKNGIRFTGSPVTLSPQLDDYGMQNILNPVASERKVSFRVVLYVPSLEGNEVRIVFPTDDTMEVHMDHGQRKMGKRQGVLWSRDCKYMYKLPKDVSKGCLTATWTNDSFLIIQSRTPRPLSLSDEKRDVVDQLVPSKVCGILRPHLDISILRDMLYLHQSEVDEICNYLETNGEIPEEEDVLGMVKSFPGKLKPFVKPQEPKEEQKLEVDSEKMKSEESVTVKKFEETAPIDTSTTQAQA